MVDRRQDCVFLAWSKTQDAKEGNRTDGIIFQHAHGSRGSWASVLVKEARHGHGDEAHRDDASLGWFFFFGQLESKNS